MTMTRIEQVRALADVSAEDIALVGNKAATLATLKRAGFPVLEGVVLTTEAFDNALTAAGLDKSARPADVEAMPLPAELVQALADGVQLLKTDRLAVRSSGVAEDLPDASYAGQYETVLNVPAADLASAVRRCWASAFSDQVKAYGRTHSSDEQAALAVLIQPMVQAEAAGVAFSADPITGDRNTAVVDAVLGLGDRLVSGEASPDHWLVCGTQVSCQAAPRTRLTPKWRSRWRELARRVAAHQPGAAGYRVGHRRRQSGAAPGASDHRATGATDRANAGFCRGAARLLGSRGEPRPEAMDANEPLRGARRSA